MEDDREVSPSGLLSHIHHWNLVIDGPGPESLWFCGGGPKVPGCDQPEWNTLDGPLPAGVVDTPMTPEQLQRLFGITHLGLPRHIKLKEEG